MENQFKTMADYKAMFSFKEDGRRNNAILFRCFKDKEWRSFLRQEGNAIWRAEWRKISNMADLRQLGFYMLQCGLKTVNVRLMKFRFYSPVYKTDEMEGICEDGTPNAVRYVNMEADRVYRMKSGKFLMSIIDAHEIGRHFPVQMKTFLCEEFSRDWVAYAMSKIGNLELRTDLSFADIYGNGRYSCRDMGSCMNGTDQSDFYERSVDATPAALVNEADGEILARCVIFNDVEDTGNGKTYRLAERQYAKGGDETLKKALVELLISRGLIDGYKAVGAGCGDASSFVLNDGTSIYDRNLAITCSINWGDVLSYQDSFKWLDMRGQKAYNKSFSCDAYLDVTDAYLEDERNYDEFHDEHTNNELEEVYYDGNWMYCDCERLEEFIQLNDGRYYHETNVLTCPHCGENFCVDEDGYYSELTDEDYCCEDCRENAEEEYKKNNWAYSEYDDEYFEDENDIVPLLEYDWAREDFVKSSISVESLVRLYLNWHIEKRGDIFYYAYGKNGFRLNKFLNEVLAG